MKKCFDCELDSRLACIEGHIRGIRQMVKDQKDCSDILLQMSAVEAAIKKASKALLKNHIENCVKDSLEAGDFSVLDRLEEVLDTYK
jgi:DNA-binding FrmR family transcriptional regulator